MNRRTKLTLCVAALFSLLIAQNALPQSANSPWPCLQQNPQHTGQSPYAGPEHPALAWKSKFGEGINGSPVIGVDGTIYIPGLDTCIYAINPQGILKWKYKIKIENSGGFIPDVELNGTPTIGLDGSLYIGSTVIWSWDNFVKSKFYALERDGSLKFSIPLAGTETSNCVIGPDGSIYIGSNDDDQDIYKLYAFYPSGGQQWEMDVVGPIGTPAIGSDGTIYVAAGSGSFGPYSAALYAIRPDGSLKWRNDNCGGIGGYLYGPSTFPVILSNGLVLITNEQKLVAVDQNGEIKWSFGVGQFNSWVSSNPAVSLDGTIYFTMQVTNDSLFALKSDGTRKWANYIGAQSAPPIIDANNDVWIGAEDGKVYRFDIAGNLQWSGYLAAGNISAMALDASGILYFTSSDKNIYAYFSPDTSIVPDLQISEISFDPAEGINVGARPTVHVEMTELSGRGPTRCHVMVYHTAINPNNIIGSAYAFVPVGLKGYADVVWNTQGLQPGEYTIIAVIDGANPPESNTANNQSQTTYKLLKSIQSQMSAGSDTTWIEPGTYIENINMTGNKVVKSILGPERTIINGNGANNVVLFNQLDSTAVMDGFTIKGGSRGIDFERGGGIVRNCIIKKNETGIWNIGSMVYTDPIIENNIITENTQYAMDTNNSWALLNKNTIVNNAAGVKGYGYYSPSPTIVNCILWNNNDDLVETGSAIYSCIQNGDPGTGNISSDPLFVDAEQGDYHLQQGSPCINAGYPDPSFNDPDGSRADMGAFYYSSGTSVYSQKGSLLPDKYLLAQNYPNPFNPATTIEYQLPKDTQVTLRIFNITGELVETLIEEKQSAGYHQIQWDGRDENGSSVAGGVYLYLLKADDFSQSNKMVLIR
jgi:hypothetical protein